VRRWRSTHFVILNCLPVVKFLLIPSCFRGCCLSLSCPPVAKTPQRQEEENDAVAEEDAASGMTRRNSSDSLPSSGCTHMNTSFSSFTAGATTTPPSTNNVQQVQLFDLDEAMMGSELKDRSAGMFGDHHQPEENTSFSSFTAGATTTPPSTNNVQQVQLFDLDEAMMGSELKDRSAGMFGHQPEENDDDDDDDPFADDSSAVFDVDEDFLLLDSDDLSTSSDVQVQEALRGLTLEAKMSLVELVRSNSIGQISGLLLVA
jgi:hypothetical protein